MQNNLFRKIFCIWVTTIFLVNQFAGVSHALFCQVGTSMYGGTIIGNITTGADADKEGKLDSTRNSMSTAEPVLIPNGEFVFNAQDLAIPARGIPLVISRVYRNQREFNGAYGFGWFFNFQRALRKMDNNNIMLIDGSRGRKDEFVPTGLGNYKSPAGIYDKLKQNTDGTFTLTSKYGVVQNFDINGLLSKISDRNGNAITFAYKKNRVPLAIQSKYIPTQSASVVMMILPIESITDATGRSLTFEYDPRGRLSKIKDFAGREILYGYDVYDNLATVTDAMGQVVTYGYDDKHNLTTITDAKKQVFLTNKYDPKDRIYEQTYGAGTFLFSYDEANRQTTITDRNGFKTRVTFNTNDIPVKVEQFTAGVRPGDPTVYITTYEYNADFEVRQKTLPNGNIIKYSYYADTSNLYSESQYPLSTTLPAPPNINTTLSYESKFNQIKTIQDPKNNITTLLYDYELPTTDPDYGTKGNLVKITHPLVNGQTPIEKFSYNTYGQLIKATDANNNVTQYAYDPLTGYLLEVAKDPQGINAVTKYGYDAYGNINSITDPNGHIFKATFNKNNKVVEKTDALGFKSKLSYDENNNLKTVEQQVDALATQWRKTSYTYTLTDKIKTITDPLNQVTIYDYDANENVIAITDALNRVTQLVYDERNLLYK